MVMSISNSIRRSRGYNFETKMVMEFNGDGWHARRLGGTSVGLPDLIITNNKKSILWSVENKSTYGDRAYIPQIQIQRCYSMLDMFSVYENKKILFAFKFATKKPRSHHYHFFKIHKMENVKTVSCKRDGTLTHTKMDRSRPSVLECTKYYDFDELKEAHPPLFC